MTASNDSVHEGALHEQEAVVRALLEELGRLDPLCPAAAGVRMQLAEEFGRLAFKIAGAGAEQPRSDALDVPFQRVGAHRRSCVLIVEDNDGTRTALARWLRKDYDVVTAQDGEEGFTLASASPPDVILTDLWMPRVDGTSMVRRLRDIPSVRAIPVIFLTGQAAAEEMHAGVFAGGVTYLPKPVDLDAVESAIHAVLTNPGPRSFTNREQANA